MYKQGSMTIVESEDQIHELARHVTFILTIEYKRVCWFVRGLSLSVHMSNNVLLLWVNLLQMFLIMLKISRRCIMGLMGQ